MTDQKTFVVTCSLKQGSVERVRERLLSAGFHIDQVLEFAGSIVGTWDRSMEELENLSEVDAVESSETRYSQQDEELENPPLDETSDNSDKTDGTK